VPSQEGGWAWWSVDHLVVDQDAVPTFVEVNRAGDTRARCEVVAQMLNYAANGAAFWLPEQLRAWFWDVPDPLTGAPISHKRRYRMNLDDFPAPKEGFVATHVLVVADQEPFPGLLPVAARRAGAAGA
jgi:hypothetical protein